MLTHTPHTYTHTHTPHTCTTHGIHTHKYHTCTSYIHPPDVLPSMPTPYWQAQTTTPPNPNESPEDDKVKILKSQLDSQLTQQIWETC